MAKKNQMTEIQLYQSYHIGSAIKLADEHKRRLVSCFEKPMQTAEAVLGGRAAVSTIQLKDIG